MLRSMLSRVALPIIAILYLTAITPAAAQESPADWIKRILAPASIGVTPFPGATLSRKLSVDTISKADPRTRVAIYLLPIDRMRTAVDHFTKTLSTKPAVSAAGTPFARYVFHLDGKGSFPKTATGLTITISRSLFADGRAQIDMHYRPPK